MEGNTLITRTKILVPRRRPELLERPRLLNGLFELLDNKLIIVAAAAGYGKTSLLIDFVHKLEWPVCWYALDSLDQDPIRFITHFIAALQLRFPHFGSASLMALQTTSQERLNLDLIVATMINDAYENIPEHFVIVLDDYHLVDESKPVNQFVSRFIQDMDENCHLMIASRTLLSLPDMPLLVARSQVGGMSYEELAFRPEEIRDLLLQNQHLTISEVKARDLVRQTEGWITGLLLSAQLLGQTVSEKPAISRVSGVGLYEYLAQQVFANQPVELQNFLLRTSLLEEFDADFCEEVIGKALGIQEDWDELMISALRGNLFILPVEDERVWFRYHHLFSEFLQNRIIHDRPEEAEKIQLRLAEVYARHGQWEQVYRLYQHLGKQDAIANLIEEAGLFMVSGGRINTLSNWLVALPERMLAERPALLSLQGSVAVMRGDVRHGLVLFDQAIESLSQAGISNQLALTLVHRSGAHRLLGEYTQAMADAEEALWLAGHDPSQGLVRAEACRAKGVAFYHQGQLKEALSWLTLAETAYRNLEDGNNSAKLSLEIGVIQKAAGNYEAAEEAYTRALAHWEATNNSVWQANLLNNLGVLQHLRGDYVAAALNFERAIQHAKIGGYPRLEAFTLTSIGDLYRDLEAVQEALEAYRQARQIAQRIKERFLLFYLDLAEGVLARTQDQRERARSLLSSAQQMAEDSGSHYERNLCRLELSVLALTGKQISRAVDELNEAVFYFGQEGHQAELTRARLYLAAAYALDGEAEAADDQIKQAFSMSTKPNRWTPVVTAAREISDLLRQVQNLRGLSVHVAELLEQVEQFDLKLPGLRNQVRRRTSVVPFAPPRMVIRALGKIEVKIDDRPITSTDWQTQTARDLFFFLLAHPEGLTKEAVGLVFWQESSPAELKLRFKNTMYRLRHAAGRDIIVYTDEYYRFNTSIDYEYDVEFFGKEIVLAQQTEDVDEKIIHYQAAIHFYKGSYLPEVEETWVVAERERMYQVYLDALLVLSTLFLEMHQYQNALESCQQALKEDLCSEAAHRLAMRIHAAMGNRAALVRQYEQCKQLLMEEYHALPSPQTDSLYEMLTR